MSIDVRALSDENLLASLATLTAKNRHITAELLYVLGEIDARRLYLGHACSSMFAYLTERQGYSESAAGKRIRAARAARRFPVLLERVANGQLHLSGICTLAAHLTAENCNDVIGRAQGMTRRQIEDLVAEINPQTPNPALVRALPLRGQPEAAKSEKVTTPNAQPLTHVVAGVADTPAPARHTRAATVSAVAPRQYQVRVTVDGGTRDVLEQLQNLTNKGADDVVSEALELLLSQKLAVKAAQVENPRKSPKPQTRTRRIPAAVRREVWRRDGGRCGYRNRRGHRCTAVRQLEFHHVRPYACGGEHSVDNVMLLCRAHNAYQAEIDFGAEFMARARGANANIDVGRVPDEHRRRGSLRSPSIVLGVGAGGQ